jgi:lipid A 3-O-deacylase
MRSLSLMLILTSLLISPFAVYAEGQEVRVGIMKNDLGSGWSQKYEASPNVNFEYLLSSWTTGVGSYIFTPRPHVGMSINTRGGTSQLYAGLTWRINLKSFFIEPSFGGEIHNAKLKHPKGRKKALGSRLLFRESIAVGYQFTEHHSLSVMVDHASNAGTHKPNCGITTVGIRYGYKL